MSKINPDSFGVFKGITLNKFLDKIAQIHETHKEGSGKSYLKDALIGGTIGAGLGLLIRNPTVGGLIGTAGSMSRGYDIRYLEQAHTDSKVKSLTDKIERIEKKADNSKYYRPDSNLNYIGDAATGAGTGIIGAVGAGTYYRAKNMRLSDAFMHAVKGEGFGPAMAIAIPAAIAAGVYNRKVEAKKREEKLNSLNEKLTRLQKRASEIETSKKIEFEPVNKTKVVGSAVSGGLGGAAAMAGLHHIIHAPYSKASLIASGAFAGLSALDAARGSVVRQRYNQLLQKHAQEVFEKVAEEEKLKNPDHLRMTGAGMLHGALGILPPVGGLYGTLTGIGSSIGNQYEEQKELAKKNHTEFDEKNFGKNVNMRRVVGKGVLYGLAGTIPPVGAAFGAHLGTRLSKHHQLEEQKNKALQKHAQAVFEKVAEEEKKLKNPSYIRLGTSAAFHGLAGTITPLGMLYGASYGIRASTNRQLKKQQQRENEALQKHAQAVFEKVARESEDKLHHPDYARMLGRAALYGAGGALVGGLAHTSFGGALGDMILPSAKKIAKGTANVADKVLKKTTKLRAPERISKAVNFGTAVGNQVYDAPRKALLYGVPAFYASEGAKASKRNQIREQRRNDMFELQKYAELTDKTEKDLISTGIIGGLGGLASLATTKVVPKLSKVSTGAAHNAKVFALGTGIGLAADYAGLKLGDAANKYRAKKLAQNR